MPTDDPQTVVVLNKQTNAMFGKAVYSQQMSVVKLYIPSKCRELFSQQPDSLDSAFSLSQTLEQFSNLQSLRTILESTNLQSPMRNIVSAVGTLTFKTLGFQY